MKRISFKVAKAIKEAGYPQEKKDGTALYPVKGEFKGKLCSYNSDAPDRDKLSIVAPTYFEVWDWLWQKQIYIIMEKSYCVVWFDSKEELKFFSVKKSPEKAIIAAIDYLVENNLIK